MKRFTALFAFILMFVAAMACAQDRGKVILAGAPTPIRNSAVLTTSDVNSSTFTLAQEAKAVYCYVGFTVGESGGMYLTPISQTNTDTTVSKAIASMITVPATTGNYVYRIHATDYGGKYAGFAARAVTGATSTLCALSYRIEY